MNQDEKIQHALSLVGAPPRESWHALDKANDRIAHLEAERARLYVNWEASERDLSAARARIAALEAERDRLKAGIKEADEFTVVRANIIKLHDDLAASRAREQRLREALEELFQWNHGIVTFPVPETLDDQVRAALAAQEEMP